MNIIRFLSIDSTNEYLKKNYENLNHETICVANTQTAGRGRYERLWHDDGSSCLFSILLKEKLIQDKISMYSLLTAYATHKVLSKYHKNLSIKWPNDILLNGKKVAGILLESRIKENDIQAIIIGIGINTNTKVFNHEIKNIATSFLKETDQSIDHDSLIIEIFQTLKDSIECLKTDHHHIIHYLNHYHILNNKEISYTENGKHLRGIVKSISHEGKLIITRDQQFYELSSGEIIIEKE